MRAVCIQQLSFLTGHWVGIHDAEPNVYKLTQVKGTTATFERFSDNADVPARLTYTRQGDTLTFRGTGDKPEEEPLILEFRLRP